MVVARTLMLTAVAAEALAGFLPWVRSGRRERTSFELIDAARTLDVLDSGLARGLAVAWYLVPLAAALCWLAVLLHFRRTAAVVAIAVGLLGVGLAFSIERAPVASLAGVRATLVAGVAVIAGAGIELMVERRTT